MLFCVGLDKQQSKIQNKIGTWNNNLYIIYNNCVAAPYLFARIPFIIYANVRVYYMAVLSSGRSN